MVEEVDYESLPSNAGLAVGHSLKCKLQHPTNAFNLLGQYACWRSCKGCLSHRLQLNEKKDKIL